MNKIAAYQIALAEIEQEKYASALIEAYGTMDGYMPEGYLQAFDEMEKEAVLSSVGRGVQSFLSAGGKILRESGEAAAKAAPGTFSGVTRGRLGNAMESAATAMKGDDALARGVGAAALGAGGLAAGGMGASFLAGRATAPRQQR